MAIYERFFQNTNVELNLDSNIELTSPLAQGKTHCLALLQGIPTEIYFTIEPKQEKFSLGTHTNLQTCIEALTGLWQDQEKLKERLLVKQALRLYEKGMRLALADEFAKTTVPFFWLTKRGSYEECSMYQNKLRYFLTLLAPLS